MTQEQTYQLIAIILYMALLLYIGWYAYRRTASLTDYMLGGRSLGPLTTALSAGAADMSGWLLMALPGAIYLTGLAEAWMAIGLLMGAYMNWLIVAPRLRAYTAVNNTITIPSFLENRLGDTSRLLRIFSSIIILVFFTFYVSSGMVSGGKFFESSFSLNYHYGLLIVAAVVVAYTLFGGFLAVSYTDVVQGLIMFLSLILVPIVGLTLTGGISETIETIRQADATHLSLVKGVTFLGVISSLAWGLGYFGQPHIIVRFMAIKTIKETKRARLIGMSWMFLSLVGAAATALVGYAYFLQQGETLADHETIFIVLGQILFHPIISGVILAAVLSAVMSTISSQLIVTSSALIEDLYKVFDKKAHDEKHYVLLGRLAVLTVSIVAILLAWPNNESILELVSFAWAGFGSAFGPVILLSLYWRKITAKGAMAGMVTGAIVSFIWGSMEVLKSTIYEIVPGFALGMVITVIVSLITYEKNEAIDADFTEMKRHIKAAKK
ncbi:sodium:proline symporter [Lysinibacillus alkalisoli]|uniref:Sodium/proline symporter n=1 Tax=Lysinibacillus alkalisoli TaxID=1911548 RepID=A0A917FYH5_9BACI|nr:sodium/proline symporter PutP [Lysinibacillus alkalisoli]GGG14181.1 sodium:proline symporter [Lysinibacillus alkalisoli]